MNALDIKINIKKLTDYSESLKSTVDDDTLLLMIKSFAKYIRVMYGCLIEEAIYSKRYKGKWEPTEEEGYLEYLGTTPKIHIIYLIEEALEVKKVGTNFMVRINPHYKYPGSRLTLLKVLRAIESGTSKFNARPILAKEARKINRNIKPLWRGYLKMKGAI